MERKGLTDSRFKTPLVYDGELPRCTYCGRPAIYRRKTSGEYFCPSCFIKAFIRRVRKTIAENSMLTPTSRILLFFSPDIPYTSFSMIDSVIRLEREYPTEIYISLPSDYKWISNIGQYVGSSYCDLEEKVKIVIGSYSRIFSALNSFNERYLFSRIVSLSIAKRVNANSVLLSYSLESLAVLTLANILSAQISDATYIEPVVKVSEIIIGYPLYDTPWDDIIFYAYLRNILELDLIPGFYSKCSRVEKRAFHIYRDLALISKETAYNILKNPGVFRKALGLENVLVDCAGRTSIHKLDKCRKYRSLADNVRVEILSPCQLIHS